MLSTEEPDSDRVQLVKKTSLQFRQLQRSPTSPSNMVDSDRLGTTSRHIRLSSTTLPGICLTTADPQEDDQYCQSPLHSDVFDGSDDGRRMSGTSIQFDQMDLEYGTRPMDSEARARTASMLSLGSCALSSARMRRDHSSLSVYDQDGLIGALTDDVYGSRRGRKHTLSVTNTMMSSRGSGRLETPSFTLNCSQGTDHRFSICSQFSAIGSVRYAGHSPMPEEMFEFDIGGRLIYLTYDELRSHDLHSKLAVLVRNPKFIMSYDNRVIRLSGHQFFIERPPSEAKIVFHYYKTGMVKKPRNQCEKYFISVLSYWDIPPSCQLSAETAQSASLLQVLQLFCQQFTAKWEANLDPFDHVKYGEIRRVMWQWLEEPPDARKPRTLVGKVFNITSMSISIMSIIVLVLGSMPELRQRVKTTIKYENWTKHKGSPDSTLPPTAYYDLDRPIQPLYCIMIVCIVWFSMEFFWRLIITADRKKFLCSAYGIIDLATIVPFYLEIMMPFVFTGTAREFAEMMFLVRGVRVLRAAYVFKLLRYSPALQLALYSFCTGKKELFMFMILFLSGLMFFSITVYYVEREADTPGFESIPAAMWWGVIAITMVGYGDVVPRTSVGKILASCASIWGLLILSFPSAMVVEKGLDGWAKMKNWKRRGNNRRRGSMQDEIQNNLTNIASMTMRKALTIRHKNFAGRQPKDSGKEQYSKAKAHVA